MRRFYAPRENFRREGIVLESGETRHLRDVLRLRRGDEIQVFDGEGREFRATVVSAERSCAELALIEEVAPAAPESPLELTMAVGLLKGEKFDLIVQKAVELGVTAVAPLSTARCDVKLNDPFRRVDRWQKIALEAGKQSGRAKLMKIFSPVGFDAFTAQPSADPDQARWMFSERGGTGLPDANGLKKITALVGPEGGWEDTEIQMALERGFEVITLGGRILRAETAAVSVAAVLQHRFGDLS